MPEQQTKLFTKDKQSPVKVDTISFNFNEEITRPIFTDDKKGFIKYGSKNLFPDYLLKIYLESGKHNGIVNRKIKMVSGNGFEQPQTNELKEFINNRRGSHKLTKILKLIAADQEVFKGFAMAVRWNIDKTKIVAIDYIPFHKVRIGTTKNEYWISDDWTKIRKAEYKPKRITALDSKPLPANFNELSKEEKKTYLVQICYFVDVSIGSDAYPIPNYFSSIEWILTDTQVAKFSYNLAKKNFLGGFHIGFKNGIPEEDERKQIKEQFVDEYGGTEGEDIIITFSESDDNPIDFNPLPSAGNENIFENTEKRAAENIFIAHEVNNPALFGIRDAGSTFAAKDELIESLEIFQAVYVDDRQDNIEEALNKIASYNDIEEEIIIDKYSLGERTTQPEQKFIELK